MMEELNQEEIDKLLSLIKDSCIPSIIEIKPSEINSIKDEDIKKQFKKNFDYINDIFILPLEIIFNNILKKNKLSITYDLSELSIVNRMHLFKRLLFRYGIDSSLIEKYIPNTVDEVNILLFAKELGYPDDMLLTNEERIKRCREYLKRKENKY